jgi:hypothetical protein
MVSTKKPTPKQVAARDRNNRIWRLRGLWHQQHLLTGSRRTMALALVDAELELLGAESETARRDRRLAELNASISEQEQI